MNQPALKLVSSSNPFRAPKNQARRNVAVMARGVAIGASVPVFAHTMAHHSSFGGTNVTTAIVAGCLLYSAPTVYQWAERVTRQWFKALGLVLCLEGVLVASPVAWCSWVALGLLVAVNATQFGAFKAPKRRF